MDITRRTISTTTSFTSSGSSRPAAIRPSMVSSSISGTSRRTIRDACARRARATPCSVAVSGRQMASRSATSAYTVAIWRFPLFDDGGLGDRLTGDNTGYRVVLAGRLIDGVPVETLFLRLVRGLLDGGCG